MAVFRGCVLNGCIDLASDEERQRLISQLRHPE